MTRSHALVSLTRVTSWPDLVLTALKLSGRAVTWAGVRWSSSRRSRWRSEGETGRWRRSWSVLRSAGRAAWRPSAIYCCCTTPSPDSRPATTQPIITHRLHSGDQNFFHLFNCKMQTQNWQNVWMYIAVLTQKVTFFLFYDANLTFCLWIMSFRLTVRIFGFYHKK